MVKIRLTSLGWVAVLLLFLASCSKKSSDTTPPPNPPPVVVTDNDPLLPGNPTTATADASVRNNYLRATGYYTLSYNDSRGLANWVAWHLQSEDTGSAPRQNDFRPDPGLPTNFYRATTTSYNSTGFDRGHNCPSGDRTATVAANSMTFLMSNMTPEAPNLNQGPWSGMEDFIRANLMGANREAYIFTGNFGQGGYNSSNSLIMTIDNDKITVPAFIWKVVVSIPKGNNDLSRIDTSAIVLAVQMPNDNRLFNTSSGGRNAWRSYITSISDLETNARGYNSNFTLLSNINATIRTYLKNKRYQ